MAAQALGALNALRGKTVVVELWEERREVTRQVRVEVEVEAEVEVEVEVRQSAAEKVWAESQSCDKV